MSPNCAKKGVRWLAAFLLPTGRTSDISLAVDSARAAASTQPFGDRSEFIVEGENDE
jgi:hypothetical protein